MHEPTEYKKPRYCPRCHTLIWDEGTTACPNCKGGDFVSEIDEKEIRDYSRDAHNHDIAGYDLFNNAMCFIVIGGTALIIGVLFVFLSLIRRRNTIVGIKTLEEHGVRGAFIDTVIKSTERTKELGKGK